MILEDQKFYTLVDLAQGKSGYTFEPGYLPEVRMVGDDIYIKPTFRDVRPDGSDLIVFILFNRKGQIIDDATELVQVLPHGFLARLIVPLRNKVPEAMVMDYLIDMDSVFVNTMTTPGGKDINRVASAPIVSEKIQKSDGTLVPLDPLFTPFDDEKHRIEIFKRFVPRR